MDLWKLSTHGGNPLFLINVMFEKLKWYSFVGTFERISCSILQDVFLHAVLNTLFISQNKTVLMKFLGKQLTNFRLVLEIYHFSLPRQNYWQKNVSARYSLNFPYTCVCHICVVLFKMKLMDKFQEIFSIHHPSGSHKKSH